MADAIHYDCLEGVQAVIQGLSLALPGGGTLPSARVYLRKVLTDRGGVTLPCVLVAPGPVPESLEEGTTAADDLGYPCLVAVVAAGNADLAIDADHELLWRQQIRKALHFKRPSALTSALSVPLKRVVWEPYPVLDLTLFQQQNLWVSAALVRVVTREVR